MSNKEIFLDEVNKLFEDTIGMESAKAKVVRFNEF